MSDQIELLPATQPKPEAGRLGESTEYEVAQGAPQAHYAAITGAAICRRKARYYGLWKTQNEKLTHGSLK